MPMPQSLNPFSALQEFGDDALRFLEEIAKRGTAQSRWFGPQRMWLLTDPDAIGAVLTSEGASFTKDRGLKRTKVLLGDGLLTSEGEVHARRSRIAQPAFRKKEVQRYAGDFVEATEHAIQSWPEGGTVDLAKEFSRIALGIVARSLFGTDLTEQAPEIGAALTELLDLLDHRVQQLIPLPLFVPTPGNRRIKKARAVLDDVVYRMIDERRRNTGAGNDLLGRLLAAHGAEGQGLSDIELRDEVMTLFLAGHETTANALTFMFRLLALHPEARAKVEEEVEQVLGDRPATAKDHRKLVYTMAAFEETLRLFPPAWVLGRQASRKVELPGAVSIRKGDMVLMSPWIMHRDERFWDEPTAFRPERFLPGAPRTKPWTYFPFGGGKRACIGRSFALLEAGLVAATIVQRTELRLTPQDPPRLWPQITLRLRDGLPAQVFKRAGTPRPCVAPLGAGAGAA
ncbi:MAG: cytochrome P450 [Planctomycetota bacterium]